MTRPRDWAPLAAVDPVPGDPAAVSGEARRLGAVADEISGQVDQLRRIAAAEGLEGEYVRPLTSGATALADRLSRILIRYRAVSGALGGYAPELERAQAASRRILTRAQQAEEERRTRERLLGMVEGAPGPAAAPAPPESSAEAERHRRAMEAAAEDVERARADLRRVEAERDRAAESAAHRIRSGSDDSVKDGWWDDVKDWVHRNSGWIARASEHLGYVGAVLIVVSLFIPGVNVLTAVALAVSAGALAGHAALAASGDGSWADVALDVVALATLGLGRVATVAVKSAHAQARAAGGVEAGRAAARQARALTRPAREAAARRAFTKRGLADLRARQEQTRALAERMRAKAMDEYVNAPLRVPASPRDRVTLGGTDPVLAGFATDARHIAADFPASQKVAAAVSRVTGSHYQSARAAYYTSSGTEFAGAATDLFAPRPWKRIQDKFTLQVGSSW